MSKVDFSKYEFVPSTIEDDETQDCSACPLERSGECVIVNRVHYECIKIFPRETQGHLKLKA